MATIDLFPNLGKFTVTQFVTPAGRLTPEAARELALAQRILTAVGTAVAAIDVGVTPSGGISSVNVQDALIELDTDKADAAGLATSLAGKQPADTTLTALAGLATAADKISYWSGVDVAALTDFTPFARTLVGGTNAAGVRATLALGTLATQNGTFSGASSGTNTGDQFTGETPSTLIGRGSAAGVGAAQEITLGAGLTMTGTTLSAAAAPSTGSLLNVRAITSTGVYTPTTGTTKIFVRLQAGAGAGGGAAATAAGEVSAGTGGSAGGYAESWLTAGFSGATLTIGGGGVGVAGAAGGNGGNSSFGALLTASGGPGGKVGPAVGGGGVTFVSPVGGGIGSSGNLLNASGQPGGNALYINGAALSGYGGASMFGGGALPTQSGAGVAATSPGAGGSGAANLASTAATAGGNGGAGRALIFEFS